MTLSPSLVIISAGRSCTLQDSGRRGFLRNGVTSAGAMDWIGHSCANLMAANDRSEPVIEIGLEAFRAQAVGGPLRIGISAEGFKVRCGDHQIATRAAVTLADGEHITILPGRKNMWAYVTLRGGFHLSPVLGSMSTHARSGIGPLDGKFLAKGTALPANEPATDVSEPPTMRVEPNFDTIGPIRYLPGLQAEAFTSQSRALWGSADFHVSRWSDRMGYRLDGPKLSFVGSHDIVSDAVPLGAIQVPGDGSPIVLMADRQPTGGYPKLGVIARFDLPRLAQTRPGERVRFQEISLEQAVADLRRQHARLDLLEASLTACRALHRH